MNFKKNQIILLAHNLLICCSLKSYWYCMKNIIKFIFTVFFLNSISYSQIGGYALSFNGTNNYVNCGSSSNLNPTTALTIEMWVNLADTARNQKLLSKFGWGTTSSGFIFGAVDGKLYPEIFTNNGSGWTCYSTTCGTIRKNVWTHLAISWTSGGYMYCYVNGAKVDSVATNNSLNTNYTSLYIGRWDGGYYSYGYIDEVRLWHVARTESEIKANMYRELNGNETGLRAYYKMSNGSGTTLSDNQTNVTANNGSISGASWKASACFAGPKFCLDFDGNDDCVTLPSSLITATDGITKFTVSTWIYPTSIKNASIIFCKKYGYSLYYRFFLQLYDNSSSGSNGFNLGVCNGANSFAYTTTSNPVGSNIYVKTNNWYYVVMVYDGTQASNSEKLKLYVNGRLQTLTFGGSNIPTLTTSLGGSFYIGKEENVTNLNWSGRLDDFKIWNTARTQAEILEDMSKPCVCNETGLLTYYNFDYANGTVLYDLSSNANNGSLANMDPSTDWILSDAYNMWIGCESSDWATAKNWSRGCVPPSTDNIGIYKWSAGNELSLNGVPTSNHLFFSSTSSPTLNSNFTANGDIILNRDLNLNGYTITLGSEGYLNEGNYRLYGTSGTITTTRTLSNISAQNVGGLGATITTSANMGSTTITRGHNTQGSNSSISRYYDITPTTNTGLNATFVFSYNDNELNWNKESDLKLFKSTNGGTNWTAQSTSTVNTTDNTITQSGIDGFSRWTAADYNSPMPVELVSFTSTANERNVKLNWQTCKEINNKGFEIERKTNESNWVQIGYVDGKGNTNEITNYTFNDIKLISGKYSYRLKQIDINGNFTYHNLNGAVEIGLPSKFNLSQNYPNPFNPITKIDFELPVNGNVDLRVYDVTGKEILNIINNKFYNAGFYTITLEAGNLSSGIYIYRISTGKFIATKKMIVLK